MQAAKKNLDAVAFLGFDRTGRISPIWPLRCVHLRLSVLLDRYAAVPMTYQVQATPIPMRPANAKITDVS
jgi:hypothetical protein